MSQETVTLSYKGLLLRVSGNYEPAEPADGIWSASFEADKIELISYYDGGSTAYDLSEVFLLAEPADFSKEICAIINRREKVARIMGE